MNTKVEVSVQVVSDGNWFDTAMFEAKEVAFNMWMWVDTFGVIHF